MSENEEIAALKKKLDALEQLVLAMLQYPLQAQPYIAANSAYFDGAAAHRSRLMLGIYKSMKE
jgi:hypothetical protein